MISHTRQLEAAVMLSLAILSYVLFLRSDPWSVRDGVFFEQFVAALPFFLLTPTLIGMSLYVAWHSIPNRLLNLLAFAVFFALPFTRAYAGHLFVVAARLWGVGPD